MPQNNSVPPLQKSTPSETNTTQELVDAYGIDAGEAFAIEGVRQVEAKTPARPMPPRDPITNKFISKTEAAERGLIESESGFAQEPIRHPRSLLRMARLAGLSKEDIESTPSDELMDIIADHQAADRRSESIVNNLNNSRNGNGQHVNDDGPVAPPPQREPSFFDDIGNDEEGNPYKFDELHPAYRGTVQKLLDHIKKLDQKIDYLMNSEGVRSREKLFNEFDQVFNEFPEFFDRGATERLKDGPGKKRRLRAIDEIKQLFQQKKHTNPEADCRAVIFELFALGQGAKGPHRQAAQESDDDEPPVRGNHFANNNRNGQFAEGQRPARGNRFAERTSGREPRMALPADEDQIPAADFYDGAVARPSHRSSPGEPPGPNRMAARLDRLMRENNVNGDYEMASDAFLS